MAQLKPTSRPAFKPTFQLNSPKYEKLKESILIFDHAFCEDWMYKRYPINIASEFQTLMSEDGGSFIMDDVHVLALNIKMRTNNWAINTRRYSKVLQLCSASSNFVSIQRLLQETQPTWTKLLRAIMPIEVITTP